MPRLRLVQRAHPSADATVGRRGGGAQLASDGCWGLRDHRGVTGHGDTEAYHEQNAPVPVLVLVDAGWSGAVTCAGFAISCAQPRPRAAYSLR